MDQWPVMRAVAVALDSLQGLSAVNAAAKLDFTQELMIMYIDLG